MKRKKILLFFCFAALCLNTVSAFADLYGTAAVKYVGLIRGLTLDVTASGGSGSMDAGLASVNITNLSLTGPNSIPSDSYLNLGYEQAFCIDLYDNKPYVAAGYSVLSLDAAPDPIAAPVGGMGSAKAGFIAELLMNNTYETATKAAAVQVAIWEILEEQVNNWNVSNGQGNFYLGTGSDEVAVAGLANTMLNGLTTGLPFDRLYCIVEQWSKGITGFGDCSCSSSSHARHTRLGCSGLEITQIRMRA